MFVVVLVPKWVVAGEVAAPENMSRGSSPNCVSECNERGVEEVECIGVKAVYVLAKEGDLAVGHANLDGHDVTSSWDGELHPTVRV